MPGLEVGFSVMYTLYITLYNLYIILYTLYVILYTLYITLYTLYSTLYTLYITLYTLYIILYTLYITLYTLYIILYTLYIILYNLYIILYTLYITLYTLYITLYTLYITLYTLYITLYTLYIILYTLYITGKQWIKQMVISAALLPLNICAMVFSINFIAIYYHASRAIPFGTMVRIFLHYMCVLYTAYCILRTVYCILRTVYCIVHSVAVVYVAGGYRMHLSVCHPATDPGRHGAGPQYIRPGQLPVQNQCGAQTYSGEEMVHGAGDYNSAGRNSPLRLHLH